MSTLNVMNITTKMRIADIFAVCERAICHTIHFPTKMNLPNSVNFYTFSPQNLNLKYYLHVCTKVRNNCLTIGKHTNGGGREHVRSRQPGDPVVLCLFVREGMQATNHPRYPLLLTLQCNKFVCL
jgi:hypothetical protein